MAEQGLQFKSFLSDLQKTLETLLALVCLPKQVGRQVYLQNKDLLLRVWIPLRV